MKKDFFLPAVCLLLAALLGSTAPVSAQTGPCVTVGNARICGQVASRDGYSANQYLGIRYATAARFANPVIAPPVTLQATQPGSVCPQIRPSDQSNLGNEDCLFLNIWTPTGATPSSKLPVLFYIHGGAFIEGGSTPATAGNPLLFDGLELSNLGGPNAQGLVVVTINYRLGALGFLKYSDATGSATGNYGFLDQLAALGWVKKHIGAFGGDSSQVTLAGQSAGAISAGYHAFSSSQSSGLFRNLILESNPFGVAMLSPSQAQTIGATLVGQMSCDSLPAGCCPSGATSPPMSCLLNPSPAVADAITSSGFGVYLQYLTGLVQDQGMFLLPWAPYLDGSLLKNQPLAGVRAASAKPMIIGTNEDEGVYFSSLLPAVSPQLYQDLQVSLFGQVPTGRPPEYVCNQNNCSGPFAQLITDYVFTCANHALLEQLPVQSPTWAYRFDHIPSWGYPATQACKTAVCHSAELPFVWDSPAGAAGGSFGPGEGTLSDRMARFWAALVAQNNPNKANGAFVPTWPPYGGGDYTLFQTGSLGLTQTVPAEAHCGDYWDGQGYPGVPAARTKK